MRSSVTDLDEMSLSLPEWCHVLPPVTRRSRSNVVATTQQPSPSMRSRAAARPRARPSDGVITFNDKSATRTRGEGWRAPQATARHTSSL